MKTTTPGPPCGTSDPARRRRRRTGAGRQARAARAGEPDRGAAAGHRARRTRCWCATASSTSARPRAWPRSTRRASCSGPRNCPEADGRALDVDGDAGGLQQLPDQRRRARQRTRRRADVGCAIAEAGRRVGGGRVARPRRRQAAVERRRSRRRRALSPPALGKTAVAVQGSKSVLLFDRKSGAPIQGRARCSPTGWASRRATTRACR